MPLRAWLISVEWLPLGRAWRKVETSSWGVWVSICEESRCLKREEFVERVSAGEERMFVERVWCGRTTYENDQPSIVNLGYEVVGDKGEVDFGEVYTAIEGIVEEDFVVVGELRGGSVSGVDD